MVYLKKLEFINCESVRILSRYYLGNSLLINIFKYLNTFDHNSGIIEKENDFRKKLKINSIYYENDFKD